MQRIAAVIIVTVRADPWPMSKCQTMAWVDHDYSRIMISSRLLPILLCNDVQSWILGMAYSVNIFTAYNKSSSLHLYGNFYKLNTANSSLIFLLDVHTLPNHGLRVLRHWPVTHVTNKLLLTRLTMTHWPSDPCLLWSVSFRLQCRNDTVTKSRHYVREKLSKAETEEWCFAQGDKRRIS